MAAFSGQLQKGANQFAQKAGRALVKNVHEQIKETAQDVREQVTGSEVVASREGDPAVVQEIKNNGAEQIDRNQIRAYEQTRIAELEARIMQIAAESRQQKEQTNAQVSQQMEASAQSAEPQQDEMPQGKLRGAVNKIKQKAQSIISTRKQSESKSGTGKG